MTGLRIAEARREGIGETPEPFPENYAAQSIGATVGRVLRELRNRIRPGPDEPGEFVAETQADPAKEDSQP